MCRHFTRVRVEYLVYYIHRILSVATYPLTMPSIRGGILGWNIDIYTTRTDQFDWSVSRAYVINIYTDTNPITRTGKKGGREGNAQTSKTTP